MFSYLVFFLLLGLVSSDRPDIWTLSISIDNQISTAVINERPIIAVMSQELSRWLEETYGNKTYSSYISASYVKFLESSGARVVPVLVNQPDDYYETIFRKTNGFLIPGGSASIFDSGYSTGAKKIFQLALEAYTENGDYYPIWGTCLGFELLLLWTNEDVPNLTACHCQDVALKLNYTGTGFFNSRLGEKMSQEVVDILSSEDVTVNFHKWCLAPETFFNQTNLRDFWTVLATNVDNYQSGVWFISLMEANHYPIWGSQFHPEKNAYEWTTHYKNIPHSRNAIFSAQFFADFFVEECRKSKHTFNNKTEEQQYLIYNYSPAYTGGPDVGWIMEQCYLFK